MTKITQIADIAFLNDRYQAEVERVKAGAYAHLGIFWSERYHTIVWGQPRPKKYAQDIHRETFLLF